MLRKENAHATVAVKDMDAARKFYEETLGLKEFSSEGPGFVAYGTRDSTIFVYRSKFAGTHDATAITWIVAGIEKTVEELNGRGVVFEHYDMPGATLMGDIHVLGKTKVAWFKDPDGNIHSVAQE
jgi:catechol 2,3-dioxygenase-like lactoylglutathione lyase family enzyme